MKPEHMTVSLGCMSDGDTASWVDAQDILAQIWRVWKSCVKFPTLGLSSGFETWSLSEDWDDCRRFGVKRAGWIS